MKNSKLILLFMAVIQSAIHGHSQTLDFTLSDPRPDLVESYGGSFASGDIDGDGDIDLLMTGLTPQQTTKLLLNNGTGDFEEVLTTPFPRSSVSETILTDLDGDGDLDLFFAGRDHVGQLFTNIYRNNGAGVFTQVANPDLPKFLGATSASLGGGGAAIGDVDGDGDQDIIITVATPGVSDVYLNDGNAVFTPQGSSVFAAVSGAVALIDIENDGDMDVIISGEDSASIDSTKLYENNGSGVFSLNTESAFPIIKGEDIDVADTDNDGDFDILLNGSLGNYLYINNGSGVFAEIATNFQQTFSGENMFSDLDNDGDQDVLIVGSQDGGLPNIHNYVYQNTGNNVFVLADRLGGEYLASCIIADFTGDGLKDVIIQGFVAKTSVFLNTTAIKPGIDLSLGESTNLSLSGLRLNREYRIMRTPDFTRWDEAHQFTAIAPTASWSEAISSSGKMFYRLEWNE